MVSSSDRFGLLLGEAEAAVDHVECCGAASAASAGHLPPRASSMASSAGLTTRRKLLLLLCIASLALLSIVLISEQLIVRHFGRTLTVVSEEDIVEVDVFTLEAWEEAVSVLQQAPPPPLASTPAAAKTRLVEDGIYWSSSVEAAVPPGLGDAEVQAQVQELRQRPVTRVQMPDWIHCGREKNRLVEFEAGRAGACARNRDAHVEFVQGEVMAFYLARLLGITNTPAVALSKVSSPQWLGVLDELTRYPSSQTEQSNASWSEDSIVALIQWLPHLTKTTMPTLIREALLNGKRRINADAMKSADVDESEAANLAQWSDLIVFDYLTGNYDRVASMQDGAEKENRAGILRETVHNLAVSSDTGSLWMLDNESAFLSAYSLLYASVDVESAFVRFHEQMLRATCVFRRRTVSRLSALRTSPDPAKLLLRLVGDNEPLFALMPKIHENSIFVQHFAQRIENVWDWIQQCRSEGHH